MATFKDLDNFFNSLHSDYLKQRVPAIVAETATEFFKQRFTEKNWEGAPWPATRLKVKSGTLMLRSGALLGSIRPMTVEPGRVVISAGDSKVPYAQIHNEGGQIEVTQKMKKFSWAMYYKEGGKQLSKDQKPNPRAAFYKAMALKKTGSTIIIPRRQFMGHSQGLNQEILKALKADYNHFLKR